MSMKDTQKLLVKHGFIKEKSKNKYRYNEAKEAYEAIEGGIDPGDANIEMIEKGNILRMDLDQFSAYVPTGYPDPQRQFRLVMQSATTGIEEPYFWVLENIRIDSGFSSVEKIIDVFSASEQSAFWGAAQARLGIQQDRVSQYLKGVSEMIKQLFQLVRELRVLDEKLKPRTEWKLSKSADVALKGEYTDLVENRGGQIQPGSVYHLAQSVGYAVLPDLFFNTQVYEVDDIDRKVDALKFNPNVKNVLRRKLYAFINWKVHTDKELETRRVFTLKYLRQHWNTIKMYMNWIKPYLRNIARMQMNKEHIESPDIVSAFETSMAELEFLAYRPSTTGFHPCILVNFLFRTQPELSFQKDQYAHRGPVHVGRVEITFRNYGWTMDQIAAYKRFKRDEDMMLMGMVDESVKAAMEALGEELEKYLWEAGEKEFEEKRKAKEASDKKKQKDALAQSTNMLEPFMAIFKGFGEMFSMFSPFSSSSKSGEKSKPKGDGTKEAAAMNLVMYQTYKNFKKAHQMLSW
ncbi:MAG: hypothetical protein V1866_06000 [archaeon]